MEIITGRLTADAKVNEIKGDKKVTNFNIAINYRYRRNGETVEDTTYVECAYWLNAGIAPFLKKGTQVQVYGRLGVHAWKNDKGDAKATITFHVNDLTLLGKPAGNGTGRNATGNTNTVDTDITGSSDDDLPF